MVSWGKRGGCLMIKLFDRETASELGRITEDQLNFLIEHLEEEDTRDQDYYIDKNTIEILVQKGIDQELLDLLTEALGNQEGMEIMWEDF